MKKILISMMIVLMVFAFTSCSGEVSNGGGAGGSQNDPNKENQNAPNPVFFETHAPSSKNGTDGTIYGVDDSLEYSTDGGKTWQTCPYPEITGLAAGTCKIRYRADATHNASPAIDITVPPYAATVTYSISGNATAAVYELCNMRTVGVFVSCSNEVVEEGTTWRNVADGISPSLINEFYINQEGLIVTGFATPVFYRLVDASSNNVKWNDAITSQTYSWVTYELPE